MLKTTVLLERLTFKQLKVDDNEINRFGVSGGKEFTRKPGKPKNQKLCKFSKILKYKKLLKSGNLPNNNAMKRLSFLILNSRIAFNHLWLAFNKALIL